MVQCDRTNQKLNFELKLDTHFKHFSALRQFDEILDVDRFLSKLGSCK